MKKKGKSNIGYILAITAIILSLISLTLSAQQTDATPSEATSIPAVRGPLTYIVTHIFEPWVFSTPWEPFYLQLIDIAAELDALIFDCRNVNSCEWVPTN